MVASPLLKRPNWVKKFSKKRSANEEKPSLVSHQNAGSSDSAPSRDMVHPLHSSPKSHKRTLSWLKRASISFENAFQRIDDCDMFNSTSFEEALKLQLCDVKAWKPMPSYYHGSTLSIFASTGEIVDPFRREPPSDALFNSRPLSADSTVLRSDISDGSERGESLSEAK
ncbi:hypothetical protein GYMLUDRAFT_244914 [Collybiopsis luxurians FD-317 M1]|uniref:Uncharacterized protein n=1 Tax=Collybiopsis luxurians FD-317 M1 TaxID=944289 RepID=A0A0D0B830_9AGAR|nr:hypothetical protein GYMLUDRAFT_244914 [Collybiopsis luxurians FD-317 M1]